jgi:uncharacterized protein YqhQ
MPKLTLGGQAVIDGVMVRSPRFVSLAIRTPEGECDVWTAPAPSLLLSRRWLRAPFVRGLVALGESLSVGTWALVTSARAAHHDGSALTRPRVRLILARSLTLSFVVFFLGPAALARAAGAGSPLDQNLLEGGLRIALVLGFLLAIGRIPAIRQVFQYHGAEHKAVHAYEAGLPLNVDSARAASTLHPRCGTAFLLIVLMVAIAAFAALGHPPLGVWLAERVILLPVVAAVSFELLRLAQRSPRLRWLVVPGLWLQRMTTREPDDAQLAVALAAVADVLAKEQAFGSSSPTIARNDTILLGVVRG